MREYIALRNACEKLYLQDGRVRSLLLQSNKTCFPKLFRDIDEPVICMGTAIFIQNTCGGSKITVSDMLTGKSKSTGIKGTLCFNVHSGGSAVVFETSGEKNGIGIFYAAEKAVRFIEGPGADAILGGVMNDYIVFRRGGEILLYGLGDGSKKEAISCRHLFGSPCAGDDICGWVQLYNNRFYVTVYDAANGKSITFSPSGHLNRIHLAGRSVVYQACRGGMCSIDVFDLKTGRRSEIFSSPSWIELYPGYRNMLVWTVRNESEGKYLFDLFICDSDSGNVKKVLCGSKNIVIPAIAESTIVWVESGDKGDNLNMMCTNY